MLAFDSIGPDDGPSVFILHGILGSRRNWASFARRLSAERPAWRIVTVDLRNHGDSGGFAAPHRLIDCAQDVAELAAAIGVPEMVVGHSFGGKVALVYGRDHGPVPGVWALDSPPGIGDPEAAHEIRTVIAAARSLPQPVARRSDVTAHFMAQGLSEGLGRWMTTNITRAPDGLRWRFDLDAIETMLASYWAEDLWPFIESPGRCRVHILRAGRSDRWSAADRARLDRLPHTVTLPDAGHWVHVDDAAGVLAALSASMRPA